MALKLARNDTSISAITAEDVNETSISIGITPVSIGTNRCPVTLSYRPTFASGFTHPLFKQNPETLQIVNITDSNGSLISGTNVLNDGEYWMIYGTQITYTYTLNFYSQGIPYKTAHTYTTPSTSYNYTLQNSDKPSARVGYTFVGWSLSSTATVASYVVGDQVQFRYPNYNTYTLYAVWEQDAPTYTYTLNFYSQGSSYKDPVVATSTNQTYTYTLLSIDKPSDRQGYVFLGWSLSSTAVVPSYVVGDPIQFVAPSYVTYTLHAVWQEIPQVSKFYWDGVDGTQDATLIATGANVSNITDVRWNELQLKLLALDNTYTTHNVTAGSPITAQLINYVLVELRSILTAHSLSITIPSDVTAGDSITAKLFNGIDGTTYSIKDALNYIVDNI